MSTLTTTTPATSVAPHTSPLRPGRVTIATVNGVSVWFYIVVLFPGRDVYGVNLGTNSTRTTTPLEWAVGTVSTGNHDDPFTFLTGDMPGALETFLQSAGLTPTTVGTPDSDELAQARREGRQEATREFEAWKATAEETAHEYADRNELCSEFDRCMTDIGLNPRGPRSYDVTYRVELPRGTNAYDLDAEDLYQTAESGASSPWTVTSLD